MIYSLVAFVIIVAFIFLRDIFLALIIYMYNESMENCILSILVCH